jgi:spore maturation protein SpmA
MASLENQNHTTASINMIMLVVISATSLQIIPSTVIGMRAIHGAANPSDFLPASLAATVVSTILGIVIVKFIAYIILKSGKRAAKKQKNDNAKKHNAAESAI